MSKQTKVSKTNVAAKADHQLAAHKDAQAQHKAATASSLPGVAMTVGDNRPTAPAAYWHTVDTGVQMKKEAAAFSVVAFEKLASDLDGRLAVALSWPQVEHKALGIVADTITVPSKRSKAKSRSKPAIETVVDAAPHWQDVANKIAILSRKKNKTGEASLGTGDVGDLQTLRNDRNKAINITSECRRIANMVQAIQNLNRGFIITFQMDETANTKSLRPVRFQDAGGITGKLSVVSFLKLHPTDCKTAKLADLFETERDEPSEDGANDTKAGPRITKMDDAATALGDVARYLDDDGRMTLVRQVADKTQFYAHAFETFFLLGRAIASHAKDKASDFDAGMKMLADLLPKPINLGDVRQREIVNETKTAKVA